MRAHLDYPNVREAKTCPTCNREKETGLLLCWPCYHGLDARNSVLSPAIVAILNNAEAEYRQRRIDLATLDNAERYQARM